MSELLLWSSATRFHDWLNGDFPGRLFRAAGEAGAIGPADGIEAGLPDRRARRVRGSDLAAAFAAEARAGRDEGVHLSALGSEPHAWEASVTVYPVVPERGRVHGMSMINLRTDAAAFAGPERSAALLRAFTAAHAPADAELACIHPYRRALELAAEVYRPPLVSAQTLAGAYWANFLGPGHLEAFDLERLRAAAQTAWRHEWVERDRGLFLFAGPDVGQAETEAGERELLRLTEALRGALRST